LPASALVAPAPAPEERGDSAAFNRIAEQIDRQIEQLDRRMASNPDAARAEFEAKLQAALAKYPDVSGQVHLSHNPAGGDAQYTGTVSLPVPVEQAAATAGGSWPAPEPPMLVEPPPAPPRAKSEAELIAQMDKANSARPPDRYLKSAEPEPWRDFVNSDGSINTSPWRRY
jgi:hypothetical protein